MPAKAMPEPSVVSGAGAGTANQLAYWTGTDTLGGSGNFVIGSSGTLTITGSVVYVALGTNPSASGMLRFQNNQGITMRNAANSADVGLTAVNASNQCIFAYDASSSCIIGGASGTIGFLNATPVVRQTSGENLTNNVAVGGVDGTIANYTDLTTYANDAAAIRNDIYQLARKLKQVNDSLRAYGLLT